MRTIARVLAGLIALLFLIFGAMYMFVPANVMEGAGLVATSEVGYATVRAFIGAGLLTFAILILMHVVVHQNHGVMRMAILFLLLSLVGRIISLFADGSSAEAIRNLVPVSLMLLASIISLVLFLRSDDLVKQGANR